MQTLTPAAIAALAVELGVAVAFGCAGDSIARVVSNWPRVLKVLLPVVLVSPYVLVALSEHTLNRKWLALYATLPVVVAWLLDGAATADPEQRGNWRDGIILLILGLAVDLRWFESAWPAGLRALNELLLVDVGLCGFSAIRRLNGTGFDFCSGWKKWKADWKTGLRELAFLTPPVLVLGLALGFIHPHRSFLPYNVGGLGSVALRWIAIFFFTAAPEELFFRAWVQNLLERRVGRRAALGIASVVFGLSHFNKRSAHFNWRYVILALIAGVFYGRAWRERRSVPASTIIHASVDWIWSLWF